MENSKLRPAVAPAAMRNTTSFLVEQGQIPRAAKSAVPVKPHPSKPVTLQMATQWVDSIEKVTPYDMVTMSCFLIFFVIRELALGLKRT